MTIIGEILKLTAAGVAGGIAAAVFGSFFNFRRFRKEEIWKQRRDTYQSINGALGWIRAEAASVSDYYTSRRQLGHEQFDISEPLTSIEKVFESGDYIISTKAYQSLRSLLGTIESPNLGPPDHGDIIFTETERTLKLVRREAAKYLIPKTSFEYWRQRIQFLGWSKP